MEINEILQLPFIGRAFIAGIIISIITSIWGVFVVLKKSAFITDAIAHISITGIAIGLILGIMPIIPALLIAIIFSILLTYLKNKTNNNNDSLIGILYSFFFALGIILLSINTGIKANLESYLFGSLFSVSIDEIIISSILLIISLIILFKFYNQLLFSTLDEEGAYLQGIKTKLLDYLINIILSITVIIGIKSVGLILISALMLAPANSAKNLSKNFNQVIPLSILLSIINTIIGIFLSLFLNTPVGSTIVIISSITFFLSIIISKYLHR